MATATLALGLFNTPDTAAQNVYRWVDDEGKVHYTKALPPDAAHRPYDILSQSGILIERVTDPIAKQKPPPEKPAKNEPEPLYSEKEKQILGDRLLLLKYRSEQEILDAMELEIDHLKYDERMLNAGYQSVMQTLESEIRAAANQQRAGLDVDADTERSVARLQRRLRTNRKASDELEVRRARIRADFQADLARYRVLVRQYEETEPGT